MTEPTSGVRGTRRVRAARRGLAALTALVLTSSTLTGCAVGRQDGGSSPAGSATSGGQLSDTPATPVAPGAAVRTTSADVAGYAPSQHRGHTDVGSSPDRQTIASASLPPGFASPPPGSGRQRYLSQQITWSACGSKQCGRVLVPLDWDHPDGQAITLRMEKIPAPGKRTGTLFVNPGGPGGSGQAMAGGMNPQDFPGHDIIGWDPRGSGESTPVRCGTKEQTDAYLARNQAPRSAAEWGATIQAEKAFAAQCRQASGVLLDHISTLDTVRDLDYLRYLVGDKKLDYLGISYGTYVGALYAELYPQRTGRLVLDSAVNISDDDSVIQQMGFDLALRTWADWCAANSATCGLGSTRQAVIAQVTGLFERLRARPLAVDDRQLTSSLALGGVSAFLYFGSGVYAQLAQAVRLAIQGEGRGLLLAADVMNGRNDDGSYGSLAYSFPAIACADSGDEGLAGARAELARDVAKAPLLGPWFGPNLGCVFWTARPTPQPVVSAKGAAPILVLGATGDPATPYQHAVSMAHQLASGVLLTWKGAGHSVWSHGNDCARTAVRAFLNDGTVPPRGTTC